MYFYNPKKIKVRENVAERYMKKRLPEELDSVIEVLKESEDHAKDSGEI